MEKKNIYTVHRAMYRADDAKTVRVAVRVIVCWWITLIYLQRRKKRKQKKAKERKEHSQFIDLYANKI